MSNPSNMSQKKKQDILKNYALRIALNTASHPVEYAKILIQVSCQIWTNFYEYLFVVADNFFVLKLLLCEFCYSFFYIFKILIK